MSDAPTEPQPVKRISASAIVSVLVTLMFGGSLYLLLARPTSLSEQGATMLNVLLGTLGAKFVTVVDYWLGSSASSRTKDQTIADLSKP